MKLRQDMHFLCVAVTTCFLITKWMSYREVINLLIKWHKITHSSIICLHTCSYAIRMYILYMYLLVTDRPIIGRWSPDCRPIVGRWTADDRPMQNRRVPVSSSCAYLNVNARHRPI